MPIKDCEIHETVKIWHPELVNLYGCEIGEDSTIAAFAEIGSGVLIGKNCRIGAMVFIPPGVTIMDDVFVGPGTIFANDKHPPSDGKHWQITIIESGVSIGAGCRILPGVRLGKNCRIGMGSVVTKNIPMDAIAYGNPARIRI